MQSLVKSTPTSSSQQIRWIDTAPAQVDVAIVGGGFSGLVALVHLCRARPSGIFAVIASLLLVYYRHNWLKNEL
jgi:NADH dehydrogenase FAD-containing subunit